MKKLIIAALFAVPMTLMAQTTLTPQEQLEQAQKQLQEAQAALEAAKAAAEAAAESAKAAAESAKAEAESAKAAAETPTPAQQKWTQPMLQVPSKSEEKAEKKDDNSRYTAEGAVPEVNGLVEWQTTIEAPGLTAAQVYEKLLAALNTLTQGEDELEGSRVALVDEENHNIMATVREYLTFTKSFLSLDRTECNYVLMVNCHDGGATVTMNHIKYVYKQQNNTEKYTAEEWITDKMAVNKKRTRLYRISGKFRKGTIDRKDEVFKYLADNIKLL